MREQESPEGEGRPEVAEPKAVLQRPGGGREAENYKFEKHDNPGSQRGGAEGAEYE